VQLAAPPGSEDDARAFYGGVLGMAEIPKPEALRSRGGVWFQCGPQQLHVGIEADGFRPARKAHPALLVSDLDALDVEVEWDDAIPGVRRGYVSDPFGNRLELIAASSSPNG
jgi:catechol 2,3-dioxygenase-like lactoylglutathione lyase family enzyme